MVKINKQSAVKFIKSINCRFGVLNMKDQRRRSDGVNGRQSKFIAGTWPISLNQPDTLSSNSAKTD
jgi:hypothetical protein